MVKLSYNVHEAVEQTGIPRTLLYSFISSGELPTRRAGRRTIILADDLAKLLKNLPKNKRARNLGGSGGVGFDGGEK